MEGEIRLQNINNDFANSSVESQEKFIIDTLLIAFNKILVKNNSDININYKTLETNSTTELKQNEAKRQSTNSTLNCRFNAKYIIK